MIRKLVAHPSVQKVQGVESEMMRAHHVCTASAAHSEKGHGSIDSRVKMASKESADQALCTEAYQSAMH